MKKVAVLIVLACFMFLPGSLYADGSVPFLLCQSGADRALKQRGEYIVKEKDEIIRQTLQAYGGEYHREGTTMSITINGRTYKDFELQIVRGEYLFIRVPDGVLQLEIMH
ncbi:hypothetical protein ACFL9U_04650 [Thermodesulfobacteriota bacterium]